MAYAICVRSAAIYRVWVTSPTDGRDGGILGAGVTSSALLLHQNWANSSNCSSPSPLVSTGKVRVWVLAIDRGHGAKHAAHWLGCDPSHSHIRGWECVWQRRSRVQAGIAARIR